MRRRARGHDRILSEYIIDQILSHGGRNIGAHKKRNQFQAKEDVDELTRKAAKIAHCGLSEALTALFDKSGINVRFFAQEPVIEFEGLRDWIRLTRRFDPDTLICFEIARVGMDARALDELKDWGLVTRIAARDLDVVCNEALSDLHVHFAGLRSPQLYWLEMMAGIAEPKGIRFFAEPTGQASPVERRRVLLSKDIVQITDVRARGGMSEELAPLHLQNYALPADEGCMLISQREEMLRIERQMLIRAFERLLRPDLDQGAAMKLSNALRFYISAKSNFICEAQQPYDDKPGLGYFRERFKALLPARRLQRPEDLGLPRLRKSIVDALFCIKPSLNRLKRLELRFAPFKQAQHYPVVMSAWSEALKENGLNGREGPGIRFAVHFKRSLDGARSTSLTKAIRKFQREIDRDSATFHRYRVQAEGLGGDSAEQMRRIARIDFAGQERDLAISRAAFELNLLRQNETAHAALDALYEELAHPALSNLSKKKADALRVQHAAWLSLQREGLAKKRVLAAPLGITCHAGEDYAQPIEGLHAIASAMSLLHMKAGDTIGHGLALGASPEEFRKRRSDATVARRGPQFDAYVWLWSFLSERAGGIDTRLLRRLEKFIRETHPVIYGSKVAAPDLHIFQDLNERRWLPAIPPKAGWTKSFQTLWRLDKTKKVQKKRLERVAIARVMQDLDEGVRLAQQLLTKELSNEGVLLEFNPSSNWRVFGASGPRDLPYMPIIKERRSQISATLATDSPGVYGTRIENEYAIAFDGVRASGLEREEAIEVIERLRAVGVKNVH